VDGLRAVDTGTPDLEVFAGQPADYVAALRSMGAEVSALDPLEAFPDAVFVEGAALCLQEGAVIMRPGAPSRLGEAAEMAPHLEALYGEVLWIAGGIACGSSIRPKVCCTSRPIVRCLTRRRFWPPDGSTRPAVSKAKRFCILLKVGRPVAIRSASTLW
jgi:hypothetical protein